MRTLGVVTRVGGATAEATDGIWPEDCRAGCGRQRTARFDPVSKNERASAGRGYPGAPKSGGQTVFRGEAGIDFFGVRGSRSCDGEAGGGGQRVLQSGEAEVGPSGLHRKKEATMAKMVESAQALDIEDAVVPVLMKGDEPAPKEENAPMFAEPDTIVIKNIETVTEPPFPSPATSSLHKAGGAMGVVGQSLTVATANPLDLIMTGTMKTWSALLRDVFLSCVTRALDVVTHVGGQHQLLEAFDVKITELGVAVEGNHASTPCPEMEEQHRVEGARALPKKDGKLSSGVAGIASFYIHGCRSCGGGAGYEEARVGLSGVHHEAGSGGDQGG